MNRKRKSPGGARALKKIQTHIAPPGGAARSRARARSAGTRAPWVRRRRLRRPARGRGRGAARRATQVHQTLKRNRSSRFDAVRIDKMIKFFKICVFFHCVLSGPRKARSHFWPCGWNFAFNDKKYNIISRAPARARRKNWHFFTFSHSAL